MEGTMQWNDSINNEGDHLSLTKTCVLERIKTLACREGGKTAMNLPWLKFSPSSRELTKTRPRSQTHTSLIDSHFALLHFDATAATAPAIPRHPTQKSLNREQLREPVP